MAFTGFHRYPFVHLVLIGLFAITVNAIDIFLEWNVALDSTIQPVSQLQPVRMCIDSAIVDID